MDRRCWCVGYISSLEEVFCKTFFNLHKLCLTITATVKWYEKAETKCCPSVYFPTTFAFFFYFWGKCVEQKSLILPLTHPGALYIQLVYPSLLLLPVVGSAGQSPPAEPDSMKQSFISMVERIAQVTVPVCTVRYLSFLEEVFCRTCNQLTP